MLQFKLGQQLSRFRRLHPTESIPALQKPFWRYYVNVDEHQFLRLEEFESQGADVFYVAPRFSNWSAYEMAFHASAVLQRSLMLRPPQIRLGAAGAPGEHRIVYDRVNRYVCSEPRIVSEVRPEEAVEKVAARARDGLPLLAQLERSSHESGRGTSPDCPGRANEIFGHEPARRPTEWLPRSDLKPGCKGRRSSSSRRPKAPWVLRLVDEADRATAL